MCKYLIFYSLVLLALFSTASGRAVQAQEEGMDDLMRFLDLINQQVGEARPDLGNDTFNLDGSSGVTDSLLDGIEMGQEAVNEFETQEVALGVSPRFPEAGQRVTFTISGYGINTDEALYEWTIDGTATGRGYGLTSVQHTLGAVGEATNVEVTIFRSGGSAIERSLTVVPNDIDILWEAIDSYTPPFYRGKALPSYDSIIKLTTITSLFDGNGNRINPSSVVYTWEKNGRRRDFADYSGYGGKTAYMLGDFMRKSHRVGLEISSSTRGIRTAKQMSVTLHDPDILFYEKDPLSGVVYERALESETSVENGVRLVAEPFYMDRRSLLDVKYDWEINNRPINRQTTDQREMLLLSEEGVSGQSLVSVEAENPTKILQNAERSLRINVE